MKRVETSDASPWLRFRETRELGADGPLWWSLLETAYDAAPDDVIAFLAAAGRVLDGLDIWEPMLDPLLGVDGLTAHWQTLDEPMRSFLGYGLLRVGRLKSEALPAGLCERTAESYLAREEHALSDAELEWQASLWPAGAFRRALAAAATACDHEVPLSVVRFVRPALEPRAAVELMLHASDGGDEEAERSIAWRLLESASPAELTALVSLADEWLAEPGRANDPVACFRVCAALLDRGLFEPRHDPLLPAEMLDWPSDLSSDGCGLCGGGDDDGEGHEPSLAVVELLQQLPSERRERFLELAGQGDTHHATAHLISAWLREPLLSAPGRDPRVAGLPPRPRHAIALAWSRLEVAADGHLPRVLQREVIASFWPADMPPTTATTQRVIHNMRARTLRLVELKAPIQVIMRQASKLRMVERLPASPEAPERVSPSETLGWARKTTLLRLMLERLGSTDPRVRLVAENLASLAAGASATWAAAQELEAEWEAQPRDPDAAIGHYAFAALDDATGEGRGTDQDDISDIAERAFVLGTAAKLATEPTSPLVAEACRGFWQAWLLELVPAAHG